MENGGDILHNLLADTCHALALEQNAEEIGFLLDVFEDQPAFRYKRRSFRLLRQRFNVSLQFPQSTSRKPKPLARGGGFYVHAGQLLVGEFSLAWQFTFVTKFGFL